MQDADAPKDGQVDAPPLEIVAPPPELDLGAAQEQIVKWAEFVEGGVLYHPGPAGYSRPMGSSLDYGAPNLAAWELVEKLLAGRPSTFRNAVFNVYWNGADPGPDKYAIEQFVRDLARSLKAP